MRKYIIDPEKYKNALPDRNTGRIFECISELINRFNLRNGRVLSIGCGWGHEEVAFSLHGNNDVLMIDTLEEISDAPQILEALKTCESSGKESLSYLVADARDAIKAETRLDCDVFFCSGFTPDEKRRGQIVREPSYLDRKLKSLTKTPPDQWPKWRGGFHSAVLAYARYLRPGGFFIVQSFGFGIDALYHRDYLKSCERQLRRHGLELIEVYRFAETVGIMLYIARKRGGRPWEPSALLTRFHGRAITPERVERIYP